MTRYIVPLLLVSLLFASCSDDDNARNIRHFYYPVWSPDGSFIIASYEDDYADPASPRPEIYQLAVRNTLTNMQHIISIKPGILYSRYFVTPENNAIAILKDGLDFYSLEGAHLAGYTSTELGIIPQAMTFSEDEKAFIWAAWKDGEVFIVRTLYTENAWEPTGENIIQTFPASSKPMDIKLTNQNSIVVALEEGSIVEYPFFGGRLNAFNFNPYPQQNPWLRRLEFVYDDRDKSAYVYTMNDIGLVRFNLTSKRDSLIVNGAGKYVSGFDASDAIDAVLFEVSDGDIYGYKPVLLRRAPAHRMPKFAPNDKRFVAVSYMNPGEDSLHIIP